MKNFQLNTTIDFKSIIALAVGNKKQSISDEFGIENFSDEIAVALKEAVVEERKAAAKTAAEEIIKIITLTRQREETLIEIIREARRTEANAKKQLAEIAAAKEEAKKNNNYVLLFKAIGGNVPTIVLENHPELLVLTPATTPTRSKAAK